MVAGMASTATGVVVWHMAIMMSLPDLKGFFEPVFIDDGVIFIVA